MVIRITPFLLCTFLCAQTPPAAPQKCLLEGKVLNSVTGEPLRKAHVTLVNLTRTSSTHAVTGEAGGFSFADLEAGSYILSAQRSGFGAEKNGLGSVVRLSLAAGEEKHDIVFRLTPLGAIAGRILDEDGDPIQVRVSALAYEYTRSGRQLVERGGGSTNDLGEYRIFGLQPGRYYLRAGGEDRAEEAYASAYYPATSDPAAAAALELNAGGQLRGIDMTLHATRVTSVRGRAIMPPGCNDLEVGWTTVAAHGSSSHRTGVREQDGKFDLPGIPPGPFFLTAQCTAGDQRYSARVPLQSGGGDLDGIELRLLPPIELAGQIRIEGQTTARLSQIRVDLEPKSRSAAERDHPVRQDGSFTFRNLEPDIYEVVLTAPDDLYQKTVRMGDREVSQAGIDLTAGAAGKLLIVLSANGGEIEGAVENDDGQPAASAQVIMVPADAQRPKMFAKFADTSLSGRFRMRGIAPGDYKLYAWDHVDTNAALYDPDFLRPYESLAQSVQIAASGKQSVQLKLIKGPAEQ